MRCILSIRFSKVICGEVQKSSVILTTCTNTAQRNNDSKTGSKAKPARARKREGGGAGEEEMASKPCAHGRIVWINAAPHSAILMGKCAKIKRVTPEIASKILNLVLELGREKRRIYVDANIDNFMQYEAD